MFGSASGGGAGAGGGPTRGAGKHDWIGSQLRRVYDEALEEPVPAEMLALLDRLNGGPESADEPGDAETGTAGSERPSDEERP